jgi:hypothetical protein
VSLPTDYHRLAEATHPTGGAPDPAALSGMADMLQEHSLPGASFFSHLARRAQSGEAEEGEHPLLADQYRRRSIGGRSGPIPRGILIPTGEAAGWGVAPSRKRHIEKSVDPRAQHVLREGDEQDIRAMFGHPSPILAVQFPYKHSSGITTLATHYLPILSHAHAEELSRDWPDAERAKLLNHLSIAEGKNIPQDHNAPEHAGQQGKIAKLARKKPKAATNAIALAVRGGIKRALQDFAIDRGMPEEMRSKLLDKRAAAVEAELVKALKSGTRPWGELAQHLTSHAVGAGGEVEFPTPASVAGFLSRGGFAGVKVLEALAAHKAGDAYGAQIAHWNPKVKTPEAPKPSGFVELPKADTKAVIAAEHADTPLVGAVKPGSETAPVKPVDMRSFKARANKAEVAQELPKPAFEVVPDAEPAPLAVTTPDAPQTKHGDLIASTLFKTSGDQKAKVRAAHAALVGAGMHPGAATRAIKQHLEYRRAATKLAKPKIHPGPTKGEITNKPGPARIDPQIAGTRLAYHLADVVREFKAGGSGAAAHPDKAARIVSLAANALRGKRDGYAELGEHLRAIGHPHGAAYNWHTVSRSLRDDDLMKRFLAEQFGHAGVSGEDLWKRAQKHYSLESKTAGSEPHTEFWKRAASYWKKNHGGDLKDLKRRINNSLYRVDTLQREAADTSAEGVRGMRGTYYGDAAGVGQHHHMRFARAKVLARPEKAPHVTWVTPEEREATAAHEAFERGDLGVKDFIAAQPAGFSAEIDGKVYHSTANGPMVEDRFPLTGFSGSAIAQKELYSPAALAKYTAALKADPAHETHPLVVEGTAESWKVRDGHHRTQAYMNAGRATVPVIRSL